MNSFIKDCNLAECHFRGSGILMVKMLLFVIVSSFLSSLGKQKIELNGYMLQMVPAVRSVLMFLFYICLLHQEISSFLTLIFHSYFFRQSVAQFQLSNTRSFSFTFVRERGIECTPSCLVIKMVILLLKVPQQFT